MRIHYFFDEEYGLAQDFYTLEEVASCLGVSMDSLVQAWLDERLPLYIHLQNLSCTIRRCVSPKVHMLAPDDIRYGRDFYQGKDSPNHEILMFVPELPLDAHLKIKCHIDTSGEKIKNKGKYYEYKYRGIANGYWVIKPTPTAHLSRGKYLLTDVEGQSNLGDITVHAHDEHDYLIFSESVCVVLSSFFIRMNEVKEVFSGKTETFLSEEKNYNINAIDKGPSLNKSRPPKVIFALYLIIHAWCTKNKNGEPTLSNAVDYLETVWDKSPKHGTVTRWAERPDVESIVEKRAMPGQKMALYFLLNSYCEHKKIRKSPASIVRLFNELAISKGYDSQLSFDKEEVSAWLIKPR